MRTLSLLVASTVSAGLLSTMANGVAFARTTSAKPYAGQTIIVDEAPPSPALSKQFTQETGIKVKWVQIGWDAEQQLIATSAAAHTYFADVTDVDWSKVGEYYQTKWFIPLNKYFNVNQLKKDVPQIDEFTVHGQLVGMPNDASFMTTTINMKDFQKAGIKQAPKTFAQYNADLKQLQKKHVSAHPLGIPFAAAEGLSTYWYETTAALGGTIFGPGFKPLFTNPSSPGYKAMQWMVNAYKTGLVPKAMINATDTTEMQTYMATNKIATIFSDYSANVAGIYNQPSQSKVVGQVEYIPTPGMKRNVNLGNPDGMGIPVTSKHVGAAIEFLKWFTSTKVQAEMSGLGGYKVIIAMPMRISAMNMLAKQDKNPKDGWSEMIKLFRNIKPVFPKGGPPWYPQFSNAVYTNLHSAALGSETVAQAVQAIANTVTQLNNQ